MTPQTETLALLGRELPPGTVRDAVHVAVAPVTLGEDLRPGDWVGFRPDDKEAKVVYRTGVRRYVGIVDPFLPHNAHAMTYKAGTRVFVFLAPQTTTSLVHRWTHPAFPDEDK